MNEDNYKHNGKGVPTAHASEKIIREKARAALRCLRENEALDIVEVLGLDKLGDEDGSPECD